MGQKSPLLTFSISSYFLLLLPATGFATSWFFWVGFAGIMAMKNKSALASKGVWGSVAVIAVAGFQLIDVEVSVTELLTLGAGVVSLWGRLAASEKINGWF